MPAIPLLEDHQLVHLVRAQQGHACGVVTLVDTPCLTSPRRFERMGVLRAVAVNQLVLLAYGLGVSPSRLYRLYYGRASGEGGGGGGGGLAEGRWDGGQGPCGSLLRGGQLKRRKLSRESIRRGQRSQPTVTGMWRARLLITLSS